VAQPRRVPEATRRARHDGVDGEARLGPRARRGRAQAPRARRARRRPQLFVTVACFTGAELSALSRLNWTDVDFVAGRIRIPGTKNATRDRTIDLDPQLAAALRRVPPERRIGPVLRPWANACTDLRAACKRVGIERVTPHTFRHTFGSWLVQAGVDTFVVGKLMGHKDSKMVERYYGHLAPKNKSEAMARLPRFPALFPSETPAEGPPEPCDAGVPNLVAIPGAYGAPGTTPAPAPKRTKAAISEEKRPLSASSGSEGRRTRTFNQRIKSAVAAAAQACEVPAEIPVGQVALPRGCHVTRLRRPRSTFATGFG